MFSTLFEALGHWSNTKGNAAALTFLGDDGETVESSLSYSELVQRARLIGTALLERGAAGQRAILAYPSGTEYVAAFFGCLYANVIAVPVYPPKVTRPDPRFEAVLDDSEAAVILTTTSVTQLVEKQNDQLSQSMKNVQWLATDSLDLSELSPCAIPELPPETIAFLQYTSGSTSKPKGVMVSHDNIVRHCAIVTESSGVHENATIVSWLPLFHDMGLIGAMLTGMLNGSHLVLMAPVTFVKSPLRWLKAIDRYKAEITAGPNFAYDLCVRRAKPADVEALDLSSLRVAITGAEPVRYDTVREFEAKFGPAGLKPTTICPSYGMAESTLLISGSSYNDPFTTLHIDKKALLEHRVIAPEAPEHDLVSIGCGRPLESVTVRIVDPETLIACPANTVGEIWVSGPQVASGYWNNPAATEETFRATLPEHPGLTFLRTGDMGFLHDGEVFITGRCKDLIIIRGQNHYPQDLEWTVENSHPYLSIDSSAAFAIEVDGQEQVVIVTEVDRQHRKADLTDVVTAIQLDLSVRHELHAYAVIICGFGGVPKTTSGKIQRRACKQEYLAGSLPALHAVIKNRRDLNWGSLAKQTETSN